MYIFKTLDFKKWQKKSGILDKNLVNAIMEMEPGLIDASLGGYIYKKRIAKVGLGKRSSYRTIIATKNQGIWIFLYGFEKNKRANIDKQDLYVLQEFAKELLLLSVDKLRNSEVICEVKL
jgi:hypothetical protein